MKLEGKRELSLEHFAHKRRNVSHFETVEANLADTSSGVGNELGTKLPFYFTLYTFNFTLFQRLPRVDAEEVAANNKLAHRRVAAGNMAVCVGHLAPLRRFPVLAPLRAAEFLLTFGIAVTIASVASRSLRPR